ncbi:MAG: hypothetical protein HY718_08590, partial [Planctomycetes bacterium]|nr:hypothetical protein [Planctomycetota bacterium]
PPQFSWIDHRLVRDRHIAGRSIEALALYLFLVTVADGQGLSYYSDAGIGKLLPLDGPALARARQELIRARLGEMLGNRSLGSKILRGERDLSKSHIRVLAKRFNVDPGLFI